MKKISAPDTRALKNQRFTFRLTALELGHIRQMAKSCGLTTGEYVRRVCLGYQPKQALTNPDREMLSEVRKFRADFARAGNFFSHDSSKKEFVELMYQIAERLKKVVKL